jgi:arylsulfatase A-like enzyme
METTKKKSLLLISVDCLRADHVGFMGYERPTTPFLDALAQESFVVPAAIVGGAPTYYSVPSILASRFPLDLGRDRLGIAPGEATLASALKDAGYATAAFCAGNPYISSRFGYEQGFDTFHDFLGADGSTAEERPGKPRNGSWAGRLNRGIAAITHQLGPIGSVYDEVYFQYCQRWATPSEKSLDALRRFPSADRIVDAALKWLSSLSNQPFFLWLHFMDPHSPYYPAEPALTALAPGKWSPFRARYVNSFWNRGDVGPGRFSGHREDIVELYDGGVRWVDAQIERLVRGLKESGSWERCGLAFTADHGEEFLDHGGRYHPPAHLREELIHVPLLLRWPAVPSRQQADSPFSLVHLAPTLLDALGVPAPETLRGRSLWPQLQAGEAWESPAVAECVAGCTNPFLPEKRLGPRVLAVRDARYKLVLYFEPPQELLFDLQSDPREERPLPPGAGKPVRRRLLEAAREHLRRSIEGRNVEARLRSCLRDLQLEWTVTPVRPVAS